MTSNIFKKFLGPEQISAALDEVSHLARDGGASIALIGGVALQLYGSDRLTRDIDFVGDMEFPGLADEKPLSIGGFQGKTSTGTPVDILIGGDYRSLRESTLNMSKYEPELGVRVADAEHIMVLKLVAGRGKDEEDIKTILRLNLETEGVLDLGEVRSIIKLHLGLFAVGDFNAFVDEVAWREKHDKRK